MIFLLSSLGGPHITRGIRKVKMKRRKKKKKTNKDSGETAELCLQQSILNKRNNHAFVLVCFGLFAFFFNKNHLCNYFMHIKQIRFKKRHSKKEISATF